MIASTLKRLFLQSLAVLMLSCLGVGASAAPLPSAYRVLLDTSAYAGTGWLDLQFNPSVAQAPFASATLVNFRGTLAADSAPLADGDVSGSLPGQLTLVNTSHLNALFQPVILGGLLSFDLYFAGPALGSVTGDGSVFAMALYGPDQVGALGMPDGSTNSLLRFDIDGGVSVAVADSALVGVTGIPEPGALALLLAGLLGVGVVRCRP